MNFEPHIVNNLPKAQGVVERAVSDPAPSARLGIQKFDQNEPVDAKKDSDLEYLTCTPAIDS